MAFDDAWPASVPSLPPKRPTPAELLLNAQEEFADLAATLAGFVAQLVDTGFTPEQARQIVTDTYSAGMRRTNQGES